MSLPRQHDVIVVGASLAGCRAALTLAERGLRVLLLDRQEFPRWKPCAGGVTLKALPYVEPPLRERFERPMLEAYLTFGPRHVTHVKVDRVVGWMVHRESFDLAHLELARQRREITAELGCTVRAVREHPDHVEVLTDRGSSRTEVVIGADGVNSVVSRSLPGNRDRSIGFAYEGEADYAQSVFSREVLFDFRKFPHGYGWVFPKRDHYSIGGFVYERNMPGVRRLYDEFCQDLPALRRCRTYRTKGHRVPHGGLVRPVHSGRVLIAGDAADLNDPLTGEGIYYALRSGDLAGRAAAALLHEARSLETYGLQIRGEIQEDLRYARVMAYLLYRFPRLSFFAFFKNELVCRWCVEILAGRKDYRRLAHDLWSKGILLPFHAGFAARREFEMALPS